jgi:hypothetical protein
MIAEEQARFAVQSLLARGLGATEVARRTGLARASEVWGGDVPRDRPAWYVWLHGSRGAYQLELEEASVLGQEGWRATFTIRYYPCAQEDAFVRFSPDERAAVLGGRMDATGTPRIEEAASLVPGLFAVAALEWAHDPASGATVMALAALDRIVVRGPDGAPVRDVPGWGLAVPLLTTLAGVHALIEQRILARILLTRQPGFELRLASPEPTWAESSDAVHAEALLLLRAPDADAGRTDDVLASMREAGAEVVADERFDAACRHPASLRADERIPLEVSHAWFGGEALAEDRIACAC